MGEVTTPVLAVENLTVSYTVPKGSPRVRAGEKRFTAVDQVSFTLHQGETVGLVGESGCGKTTVGRAIARFIQPQQGAIVLDGTDLVPLYGTALRRIRKKIQMIFQNPYASLNPRMTVEGALAESLACAAGLRSNGKTSIDELLDMVGLDRNQRSKYPHELSGGQRQRIAIARAVAASPRLIVADEPVSSLDVSVAAQIINLFKDLRTELQLTMLFISHDLSVVRFIADRVLVMYRGNIVESGPAERLFSYPLHPYTRNLLMAIPRIEKDAGAVPFFERTGTLSVCESFSDGCPYADRCEQASEECSNNKPPVHVERRGGKEHSCVCFHPLDT